MTNTVRLCRIDRSMNVLSQSFMNMGKRGPADTHRDDVRFWQCLRRINNKA